MTNRQLRKIVFDIVIGSRRSCLNSFKEGRFNLSLTNLLIEERFRALWLVCNEIRMDSSILETTKTKLLKYAKFLSEKHPRS